jgi:hypothetical protein
MYDKKRKDGGADVRIFGAILPLVLLLAIYL